MQKTIGQLRGGEPYQFRIPDYQRGYRWREQEVIDLMDDLMEFDPVGETQYCLQPLIVKKCEDGKYEVIDGQQRLTTLAIILQQCDVDANAMFTLEYETRPDSETFINELSSKDKTTARENIDYHHMHRAFKKIAEMKSAKPNDFAKLKDKIMDSVFFIWYEVVIDDQETVALFNRVNMGKIQLTSAELIKALLFNQQNFGHDKHAQTEMAVAWEYIEQGLHNESFWHFFTHEEKEPVTRMDILFDLLAEVDKKDDTLKAFHVIYDRIKASTDKDKAKTVEDLWHEVEQLNGLLRSWYDDLELYHLVGYLIASGTKLGDIVARSKQSGKKDAKTQLVKWIGNQDIVRKFLKKDEIGYGTPKLRDLFLLFNIATLITKGEQQNRFPFNLYQNYSWDIEHINPKNDPVDPEKVPDHTLGNLTLLSDKENRGVKNKPFMGKRIDILNANQKGRFIPTCTLNIFLKAYSIEAKDVTSDEWESADKEAYLEAMDDLLNKFFAQYGVEAK
jgi:Protein of unknown function DUF262/Protein of unknown function (DUF1524)